MNAVGVDLNTASVPLLARVSGLNPGFADNIVQFREANGAFKSRKRLMDVPRFGDKAFQLSAGFLRILGGSEPLDASAVHPEAYPVVRRIVEQTGKGVDSLIGDSASLRKLDPAKFTDERFGVPTVRDILEELEKPGRDPRPELRAAAFKEGVETLADLKPEMVLEGAVTNVTNFGAFVDIGVHQDGLVHISMLADRFIKDPHEVVKSGDLVRVRVLEVDLERKRVALTMRLGETRSAGVHRLMGRASRLPGRPVGPGGHPGSHQARAAPSNDPNERLARGSSRAKEPAAAPAGGALAAAFAKARKRP